MRGFFVGGLLVYLPSMGGEGVNRRAAEIAVGRVFCPTIEGGCSKVGLVPYKGSRLNLGTKHKALSTKYCLAARGALRTVRSPSKALKDCC